MGNETKTRILIADDKEENLKLLQTMVERSGYKTVLARNGLEALEQLKKVPVDLIISDILMPKIDGFQLCRECKTDEKLCKIPFIICTATYLDKKDEEFSLSVGADRFIIKPIEPKEFLRIIEEVLKEGKRGVVSVAKKTAEEEVVYLKEYNESLIHKLENKNEQQQKELTERKKMEGVLRESEERLRVIFDNASDGILLADDETKIFYTGNNTACQILGYSLEEIKKLGVADIHPKEDLPYVIEQFERQVRREITVAKDLPVKRKDGSVFYADVNTSSVTLAGRTYLLGIFRDVTERKKMEEEAQKRLQELEIFYKASVGREERILELKKEIEQLKKQLEK